MVLLVFQQVLLLNCQLRIGHAFATQSELSTVLAVEGQGHFVASYAVCETVMLTEHMRCDKDCNIDVAILWLLITYVRKAVATWVRKGKEAGGQIPCPLGRITGEL